MMHGKREKEEKWMADGNNTLQNTDNLSRFHHGLSAADWTWTNGGDRHCAHGRLMALMFTSHITDSYGRGRKNDGKLTMWQCVCVCVVNPSWQYCASFPVRGCLQATIYALSTVLFCRFPPQLCFQLKQREMLPLFMLNNVFSP